jgi:hypothetical protein
MSGKLIVEVVSASVGKEGSKLWDKLESASIKGAYAARGVARQRPWGAPVRSGPPAAARRRFGCLLRADARAAVRSGAARRQ